MFVLADIDGVLINSYATIRDCYMQAFRIEAGMFELAEDNFKDHFWGKSWEEACCWLRGNLGFTEAQLKAVRAKKDELYEIEMGRPIQANRVALDFYADLASSYHFAFCTSASKHATQQKLRNLGKQSDYKPHHTFLAAQPTYYVKEKHISTTWHVLLSILGVEPADTLVIDDNPNAVAAAKTAGCKTILWSL